MALMLGRSRLLECVLLLLQECSLRELDDCKIMQGIEQARIAVSIFGKMQEPFRPPLPGTSLVSLLLRILFPFQFIESHTTFSCNKSHHICLNTSLLPTTKKPFFVCDFFLVTYIPAPSNHPSLFLSPILLAIVSHC